MSQITDASDRRREPTLPPKAKPKRTTEQRIAANQVAGPPAPNRPPLPKTVPKPTLPAVTGPPIPALAPAGFFGDVHELAKRVQQLSDQHLATNGFYPTGQQMLDMATKPTYGPPAPTAYVLPGKNPGLVEQGTINLLNRPVAHNPDGSVSTVKSISVGMDGREVLLPTVINGVVLTGTKKQIVSQAVAHYQQTGEHLGIFDSPKSADAYSERLHREQATLAGVDTGYPKKYDPVEHNTPDWLFADLLAESKQGRYDEFINAHAHQIGELVADRKTRAKALSTLSLARNLDTDPTEKASLLGSGLLGAAAVKVGGDAYNFAVQMAHTPGGVVLLGGALARDVADADPTNLQHFGHADLSFKRTRPMLAAMAEGTAHSITHPRDNIFNTALNIFAGASLVRSAGSRVSAASEAAPGEKASALLTKPAPRRATIDIGGYQEQAHLLDNPLAADAQEALLRWRQGRWNRTWGGSTEPLTSILLPDRLNEFVRENLSIGAKARRESQNRRRVDYIAGLADANEMQHLAQRSKWLENVGAKLGKKERQGMSRGEFKAMEILSWDDLDPVAAERAFHERMIERFTVTDQTPPSLRKPLNKMRDNHERALADMKLAEQVLANPSDRFKQVLGKVLGVEGQTFARRVERLGLNPETGFARIAKGGIVLRETEAIMERNRLTDSIALQEGLVASQVRKTGQADPKLVASLEKNREDLAAIPDPFAEAGKPVAADASTRASEAQLAPSFYVHAEPRGKSPKPSSRTRGFFSLSRGIRVGQPRPLAELGHEFSGKSIIVGNNRVDVPDLTHEAAAKTMRAVQVLDEHEKLWESALEHKPTTGKWIPIMPLGSGKIPDRLRELDQRIHEGVVSQKDADLLTGDEYELIRALYPDEASLSPEEIKDVRWVDPVLIPDPVSPTTRAHAAFEGTMNVINAPYRTLALYARPAYALNKLGNRVMLVVDEGIWTSAQNMARANNIEQLYGPRAAAQIHQHVGAGKSLSYINPGVGKVSRGLAEWWSKWADRDERSAAFLYWADRNGYKTREEMTRLLFDEDPKVRSDLNDTVQRANKSLVRFDDLGEMGKAWLRHLIFVYPWVRGSAIWSIQMLAEHPAKASVYAALGQEAIEKDPFFDFASDWYKRVGYIPWERFGVPTDRIPFLPGADQDHLSNPSSTWTFDTLTEMAAVGKSQTVGDKYASLADLFGPAAETIAHGSLGRDKYGNRYPDWPWARAMAETLEVLPQVRAIDQKIKKGQGTDFDIRRRGSLEASLNKHARDSVFGPGWLWGTGALLAGGLSPKTLNIPAKTERYWNDQTPAVQHAHTKDLLNYALTLQGKFLGTPVPAEVRNRLNDRLAIAYQWKKHVTETGKSPSTRDKVNYTIDYLDFHGRISSAEADKLRKGLAEQHPWTIDKFLSDTIRLHAGGKALEEWDADVNALYSFKKDTFNYNAGRLYKQGLSPRASYDDVSQKELTEYGRGYIDFSHKVRALDEKVKAKKAEPSDIRSFEDANSEPHNGLPSYAAIAWAHRHDTDMAAATGRLAGHTWGSLSRVEKQILGRSVSMETQKSWDFYRGSLKANQEANGSTSYADRVYIANAIGKDNPDFLADWKVSQQSRADRFVSSPLYKSMPSEASWIFEYARKAGALIQEARVDPAGARSTVTDVRDAWKDYVESTVKPWVEAHPAVKHALAPYGDPFLGGLPNNG